MTELSKYGWNDFFSAGFASFREQGLVPARVMVVYNRIFNVIAADGEFEAETSGRFRHSAQSQGEMPAVGDWVAVTIRPGEGKAVISALLPRKTRFSRKTAGSGAEEQVIAANIDKVLIVSSLNEELNLRRLERYLSLARESGALPVLILTKADLCDHVDALVQEVCEVAPGVPVHAVSNITGLGLDDLWQHVVPGTTVAMLGSSGVGKSTLINRLLGRDRQRVCDIRDDSKGRHTTTNRELILLDNGGMVIDTPGMREIQMLDPREGMLEEFADIEKLALGCRFSNCRHQAEPACAVAKAVEDGILSAERVASYLKLLAEMSAYEARHDARLRAAETRRARVAGRESQGFRKNRPNQ
jgi:ribosome biogenesis GTPase